MACMQIPCVSTATPERPEPVASSLSRPPTGRQIVQKPIGEVLHCPTTWLTLPWGLYQDGHLPFLALRTWYGVLEMRERRCCCTPATEAHYGAKELQQLLHIPRLALVQGTLHTLEDVGLLHWSVSRLQCVPEPAAFQGKTLSSAQALHAQLPSWRTWVPVLRRQLRWLASKGTPGLCATAIGVLLRCLWSTGRQCVSGGRVAVHWIAQGFGLAERTVQRALDTLQACNWLARLPGTTAQEAARERQYGGCTVVNLAWEVPGVYTGGDAEAARTSARGARCQKRLLSREEPVERAMQCTRTMARMPSVHDQQMTPTPTEMMTVAPIANDGCAPPAVPDLYPFQEENPHGVPVARAAEDLLGDIDAWSGHDKNASTEVLPFQPRGEHAQDSIIAEAQATTGGASCSGVPFPIVQTAAVHARRVGSDSCALFVALVRERRWSVLTQADEDAACTLLRPAPAQAPQGAVGMPMLRLSDDVCFVHGVQQMLRTQGVHADAWPAIAQRYSDWARVRWDATLAELQGGCGRYHSYLSVRLTPILPSRPSMVFAHSVGILLSSNVCQWLAHVQ